MCFMPSRPWNGESGSTETSRVARARAPQEARRAHEGAARSEARHEEVERQPAERLQDLRARGPLVGARVRRVRVLVGVEVDVGPLGGQLPRPADRSVGALERVGLDELGAVGEQDLPPLGARGARHAERDAEAERRAEHRVRDPGVPARRVEQALVGERPRAIASATIALAARSLTLPPGFAASSLAKTRRPLPAPTRRSSTSGVRPIRAKSGCARSAALAAASRRRACKRCVQAFSSKPPKRKRPITCVMGLRERRPGLAGAGADEALRATTEPAASRFIPTS